ncbi:MAG: hypothetical protein RLZZ127_1058 [Planctomycetota bacterium]|jgi:uncharacterized BrkB/YihY/UPF0761 family membrane protein
MHGPAATDPRASSPGTPLPTAIRWSLALACLATAGLTAWGALPRPDDRPIDLGILRLAGPVLALLGACLAWYSGRLPGRRPSDRWLVAGAVLVLLAGAAAAAGILDAVRIQLDLTSP